VVLSVAPQSEAATLGLRQGDVILKLAGTDTPALDDLLRISGGNRVTVFRNQHETILGTP
jgi:S1-C subfamily serine protease